MARQVRLKADTTYGVAYGVAALLLLLAPAAARAQLRGVKADLAPIVEADAPAGGRVRAAVQVTLPQNLHLQSNAPRDPSLIATTLVVDVPDGVTATEVVFPKTTDFIVAGIAEPLAVFEHEFPIGIEFAIAPGAPIGRVDVTGRLRYQACNDTVCFAPSVSELRWTLNIVPASAASRPAPQGVFARIAFGTGAPPPPASTIPPPSFPALADGPDSSTGTLDRFRVVATTGGYQGSGDFLTFIDNAEKGVVAKGMFDGRGPLAIMLLVLLGGLALNLTPCVLPMIPINLAVIGAGAKAGSRSRGFLLGGAYGAAMALVYGILGLVVILTAGTFGTINASPWFNLVIALVFAALALAMFDVFTIDFSRFSPSVGTAGGRGSFALAFGMGAVAALLAGACVAPVVIQVVLFSSNLYAQGTLAALALPFLLGLGMALPWPFAGAGITALPKPGAWMVRVKQAFGIIIFVTAAYYGYLAYSLFADRWVDAEDVTSSVTSMIENGWYSSLEEGLAAAEREQKPVLIDMWATWCKNCLTMDKTTLADPAVKAALDGYIKIKVQAEQPDEPPARELMQRFDAIGLPAYAILKP
jgi:cytochrome c biogenesis protein CcdA